MTKDEIIALIDAKIAGQGTNIDAGSALPGILKGILELAGGQVETPHVIEVVGVNESAVSFDTFKTMIKIDGQPLPDDFDFTQINSDWVVRVSGSVTGIGDRDCRIICLNPADPDVEFVDIIFGGVFDDYGVSGHLRMDWGDVEYMCNVMYS